MLEIQTTNEQKGFHLAEWLLRPGAMVSLAVFPPLRCTPLIYLQLYFIICNNDGNCYGW